MALTVEDGTGLAGADALAALAFCNTYHAARANSAWAAASEPDREAAIRRASAYLTSGVRWQGARLKGRAQALSWPRTGVSDADGEAIPSDEVPSEVAHACAEIALAELATPGIMAPVVNKQQRQSSVRVGPIAVSYDTSKADLPMEAVPVLTAVQGLIGPLTAAATYGAGIMVV